MTADVPPSVVSGGEGAVGAPTTAWPRVPEGAVVRTRLLDRLDRVDPVGVLRAAPGLGRTLLAAQWAQRQHERGRVVVWVAGTGRRDRPPRTWTAVRDALAAALRHAGTDVPDDPDPGRLAAAVDSRDAPVVLVVDDADDLAAPDDVDALTRLVTAAHGLRTLLVTGTRFPLRPPAARHPVAAALDDRLDVTTFATRDLAFTADELREAAASWGHPVDDRMLTCLLDLVGGWPALARTVLDDTGPDDEEPATAAVRAFVRDVVLPDVTDAPLLDSAMLLAVPVDLTEHTAQIVLDLARRHDLSPVPDPLLPLEAVGVVNRLPAVRDTPQRWAMPAVWRDELRARLAEKHPALVVDAHRALAQDALAAHPPDARRAVEHAALAQDWTLLESVWLEFGTYLVATGGAPVGAWYAKIPDQVAASSSILAMARSVARRGGISQDDAGALVLRLMTELGTLALEGAWRSRSPQGRWTAAAAALVAARARGDLRRAMTVLRDTEVAAARAGNGGAATRSYWWFLVQAGRTALLDGDVGAAVELPARAFALADPYRAPDILAAAAAHVALVHALDGSLVEADRWLVRHDDVLDPDWSPRVRDGAADVARAMVAADRLDLPALDDALSRATDVAPSPDVTWPFLVRARVRRAVLFGDPEIGLAQLEQMERSHHVWLSQPGLVHRISLRVRAELLLALGEFHRVADLLQETDPTGVWGDVPRARWLLLTGDPQRALRAATVGGRRRRVNLADRFDLWVLEAWAAHEVGRTEQAVHAFASAQRHAREHGTLRAFAHLPASVRDDLAAQTGRPFDDAARARFATIGRVVPDPGTLVPLTPRERAVLQLLAQHETNRQVADALTVSVNTVRKQVLSIYTKLGVHDRTEALRRAHELGLLGAG